MQGVAQAESVTDAVPVLSSESSAFPFLPLHKVHVSEPAQKYPALQLTHSVLVPVHTPQPRVHGVPHVKDSSVVGLASSLSSVSTAFPVPMLHSEHFFGPDAPCQTQPALQFRHVDSSPSQASQPDNVVHVVPQVSAVFPVLSSVSVAFPVLPVHKSQSSEPFQK